MTLTDLISLLERLVLEALGQAQNLRSPQQNDDFRLAADGAARQQ